MKRKEFFDFQKGFFDNAFALCQNKNADYSNPGEEEDAFKNFKYSEILGLTDAITGVLVRMSDKMARVSNITRNEARVKDESVIDTLTDIANYASIAAALWKERNVVQSSAYSNSVNPCNERVLSVDPSSFRHTDYDVRPDCNCSMCVSAKNR